MNSNYNVSFDVRFPAEALANECLSVTGASTVKKDEAGWCVTLDAFQFIDWECAKRKAGVA